MNGRESFRLFKFLDLGPVKLPRTGLPASQPQLRQSFSYPAMCLTWQVLQAHWYKEHEETCVIRRTQQFQGETEHVLQSCFPENDPRRRVIRVCRGNRVTHHELLTGSSQPRGRKSADTSVCPKKDCHDTTTITLQKVSS